jgi:hypothetical protein
VIAHAIPTGYWIWYNGTYVYVFGEPAGKLCSQDSNYEPAYVIDPGKNELLGYECVMHLDDIMTYYTDQGAEKRYVFKHIPKEEWDSFNVYDMMNVLIDNDVIYIRKEAQ